MNAATRAAGFGTYTPPDPLAQRIEHARQLEAMLNDELRGLQAAGVIVRVTETRGSLVGPAGRVPSSELRLDIRDSIEAATSRPEACDG